MNVGQEMGAAMMETAKIGVAVSKAQTAAGLDKAKMVALQVKLEGGEALTEPEKAQIRAFGAALGPELAAIQGDLTEVGRGMAAQINDQFGQLVKNFG